MRIEAELDTGVYSLGVAVSKAEAKALPIEAHQQCGAWNYTLLPTGRTEAGQRPDLLRRRHRLGRSGEGVEPGRGTVYYVLPGGEAWFANSSIHLWLQSLHHYGLRVSQSDILSDPDDQEEEALAELGLLAEELKMIDPPAFDGYIWAEFLDRWLW
ncbi:SUKH-4 family immunity protein [Kitasatospora hibisci]